MLVGELEREINGEETRATRLGLNFWRGERKGTKGGVDTSDPINTGTRKEERRRRSVERRWSDQGNDRS
jgi:hypothetical protein